MLLHQNHPSCISAPAYKLIVSPVLVSLQNPIVSLITVFSFQLHSLFAPLSLSLAHAHSPFPGENSFRPLSLKLITSARENLSVIASFNKFPKRLAASNKLLSAGSGPERERECDREDFAAAETSGETVGLQLQDPSVLAALRTEPDPGKLSPAQGPRNATKLWVIDSLRLGNSGLIRDLSRGIGENVEPMPPAEVLEFRK